MISHHHLKQGAAVYAMNINQSPTHLYGYAMYVFYLKKGRGFNDLVMPAILMLTIHPPPGGPACKHKSREMKHISSSAAVLSVPL